MWLFHIAIECLDVEAQLADVLGAELANLQLDGNQAREPAVEEHEVDRKILVTDLHRVLGADETEVAAELGDKSAEIAQQCAVEISLRVTTRKIDELERVDIFEVFNRSWV